MFHRYGQSIRVASPWVFTFLAISASSGLTSPAGASTQGDLSVVRERIKAAWKPFDTIQFRSVDINRGYDTSERTISYDFAWDGDGRSALTFDRTDSGVTNRVHDFREDGRRGYQTSYFQTGPSGIDRIRIEKPRSQPGEYRGFMFHALWLFMPGGKTIGSHVENGGALSWDEDADPPRLILTFRHRDRDVRCELDEEHDYLPRSIILTGKGSKTVLSVDRFERDNGIWFPRDGSGSIELPSKGRASSSTFTLHAEGLAINRPIPASRFEPPPVTKGVLVEDQLAGKSTVKGGQLARVELQNAHPRPVKPGPAVSTPIRASSAPRRFPTTTVLISLAVVSGATGLWLRQRRSP